MSGVRVPHCPPFLDPFPLCFAAKWPLLKGFLRRFQPHRAKLELLLERLDRALQREVLGTGLCDGIE